MQPIDMDKYNSMKGRLTDWAADYRYRVIQALTAKGTYSAVKLTPNEQIARFMEMHEVDYETLVQTLNNRYKGLPDAYERVNTDLARFVDRMLGIALGER